MKYFILSQFASNTSRYWITKYSVISRQGGMLGLQKVVAVGLALLEGCPVVVVVAGVGRGGEDRAGEAGQGRG